MKLAIRLVLSALLLVGVYHETGVFTTFAICSMMIALELLGLYVKTLADGLTGIKYESKYESMRDRLRRDMRGADR